MRGRVGRVGPGYIRRSLCFSFEVGLPLSSCYTNSMQTTLHLDKYGALTVSVWALIREGSYLVGSDQGRACIW